MNNEFLSAVNEVLEARRKRIQKLEEALSSINEHALQSDDPFHALIHVDILKKSLMVLNDRQDTHFAASTPSDQSPETRKDSRRMNRSKAETEKGPCRADEW